MLPHHVEFTHAIGRQGQSCRLFCPVGQMYRGAEDPRLFKDRPMDENPAAAPHPSIYQRVQQRMQPCVGMPTFFNKLQQHSAAHYFASAMVAQAPAASRATKGPHRFSPCSPLHPQDGLAIAGKFRPSHPLTHATSRANPLHPLNALPRRDPQTEKADNTPPPPAQPPHPANTHTPQSPQPPAPLHATTPSSRSHVS